MAKPVENALGRQNTIGDDEIRDHVIECVLL
jgi:hypothetical protein